MKKQVNTILFFICTNQIPEQKKKKQSYKQTKGIGIPNPPTKKNWRSNAAQPLKKMEKNQRENRIVID